MDELLKYLNALPRTEQERLAASCSTTLGYLRKAIYSGELLRPALCVAIERETGRQITRQVLREDWIDIWPELSEAA